MQAIFSFTFNTVTNEAAVSGNIPLRQALNYLQEIVISDERAKAIKEVEDERKS